MAFAFRVKGPETVIFVKMHGVVPAMLVMPVKATVLPPVPRSKRLLLVKAPPETVRVRAETSEPVKVPELMVMELTVAAWSKSTSF